MSGLLRALRGSVRRGAPAGMRRTGVRPIQKMATFERQVRFQSESTEMQFEGGLRGVVGTLALVENNAVYVEAWVPHGDSLRCGDAWAASNAEEFAGVRKIHEEAETDTGIMMTAYRSGEAEWTSDINAADIPGFSSKPEGSFACAALPIINNDVVVSVFLLIYKTENTPPLAQLKRLRGDLTVAVGHILTGAVSSVDQVFGKGEEMIFEQQKLKVIELLEAEGLFSPTTIEEEVTSFYNLGLSPLYFAQNNPAGIATHLQSFIGAKRAALHALSESDDESGADYSAMSFHFVGKKEATFFCLDDPVEREDMLLKANQYVDSTEAGMTTSLTMYRSADPLVFGKSMIMCTATRSRFLNPDVEQDQEPDIWEVSSAQFLRTKSKSTRLRYEAILKKAHGNLSPVSQVRDRSPGHVMMLAFPTGAPENGLAHMFGILDYLNLRCTQLFGETFANGTVTYNVYLENTDPEMTPEAIKRNLVSLTRRMTTLAALPVSARLNKNKALGPRAKLYLGCAQVFTYHFMPHRSEDFHALREYLTNQDALVATDRLDRLGRHMHKNAVNLHRFNRTVDRYPELAWAIYEDFMRPRKPGSAEGSAEGENAELINSIRQTVEDPVDQEILMNCLLFNKSILKTNFFVREKAATTFRLSPELFIGEEFPEVPHAIFMVVGANFEGFHVRFRDISRGGIRMIKSPNQAYFKNQQSLFEENYNLAYTQQLKNKDIPEGGSKGTILLNPGAQHLADQSFKAYIDSLLDLMLENDDVVDLLDNKELLFFGPDEGTAGDVVVWAAEHAKKRGYKYWKAITTGKPATMGGIPHDTYGMTTRSVHQQVLGVLNSQGVAEKDVTKFQTGGPDGDLGSNEILISCDKTCAIVDGSGVIYDPNALDRTELKRLAEERLTVNHFDRSKLSKDGYMVLIEDRKVKLPSGEVVESGLAFRNEYHLREELTCDLFVPCGGRPDSVNINNVERMFKDGKPRFKYIVEGANLFITPDARRVLEDAGVILMKDATCNKGGVTSSSLEVLAALAMNEEQHNELVCVQADGTVPEFYKKYVSAVQNIIEENARLEFEACWRERQTGNYKYMTEITDLLSKKINTINDVLRTGSVLEGNPHLRRLILLKALPQLLVEEVGIDQILARVPGNYLDAICGAYFASQYVYRYGLSGSEVEILDFIQLFVKFESN
eukprot:TRINITY_DN7956_c2_g1_i1.p1 TRINITY_DN7956_c2_g1~~TRINITY_DN7956_c2_g1_i1.p1  ORF type:complete len:1179 (+),score=308.06 TRINITY_DN7956_c2_g1_i1:94-3630(+)